MTPTAALVMLSGIYYGSQYGGGITSIMLNLPGTASHAVACLDGNPLARNGKAGSALFMLMFSSCLLYTSPSPRDQRGSRMPSSA